MDANLFWPNDEQWAKIVPYLPTNQPGPARKDDRRILSGIMRKSAVAGRIARSNTVRTRPSLNGSPVGASAALGKRFSDASPLRLIQLFGGAAARSIAALLRRRATPRRQSPGSRSAPDCDFGRPSRYCFFKLWSTTLNTSAAAASRFRRSTRPRSRPRRNRLHRSWRAGRRV
jgi:hypothetical protein